MKYLLFTLLLIGCAPQKFIELSDGTKIEFQGQFDWNSEKHCVNKTNIMAASKLSSATKIKVMSVEKSYNKNWRRIVYIQNGETKYFYFCGDK